MVDDCTHFYGNSRRAGFHDPCGFVTDTYIQTDTKVTTEESPFRALGVPAPTSKSGPILKTLCKAGI